jgi:sugar lactone lactonase YvrE
MKGFLITSALAAAALVYAQDIVSPVSRSTGSVELVAWFQGPMPTGVSVSQKGRVFVNFPRWGDPVEFTVGEVKDGVATPFPAEMNRFDRGRPEQTLVSVQSVVVDAADRLWILDTGSVEFGPPVGAKLVGVELSTNEVFTTILFPPNVVLPTTYLNDIRIDLRRSTAGVAYITDSSPKGPNAIIVVDLDTGKCCRRLNDHFSTKAVANFLPIVEGKPLMENKPGESVAHLTSGSDGLALDRDGKYLYYCPLASRNLYRIATDALLCDRSADEKRCKAVEDLGNRGFASDGLEADDRGRIYLTDYEHNSILRRGTDGRYETLLHDPRLLWPDTMSVASDGYLYFTANQLHRQRNYQKGADLREKPYCLFRTKIDAGPVSLTRDNY